MPQALTIASGNFHDRLGAIRFSELYTRSGEPNVGPIAEPVVVR